MDTTAEPTAEPVEPPAASSSSSTPEPSPSPVSRRGFLRTAGAVGVAGMAASLAACQATAAPSWAFASAVAATPTPSPTPEPTPEASPSEAPSPTPPPIPNLPAGWTEHDYDAQVRVRRFVGNLAGPLGMSAFLDNVQGPNTDDPEFTKVVQGAQPLEPVSVDVDGTKVFKLTIDEIEQQIDELMPPVAALGYNGQWPGPTIRVNQGDRVRAIFTNNLKETTGVHFHGVEFDDFFQDGVPFVTQKPIVPGETYTYEFTARNAGSLMYHSHHNATDQVGRGLLGAFIVEPKRPTAVKADREYIWISNDSLGGFTINGHGFPATVPVARRGGRDGAASGS